MKYNHDMLDLQQQYDKLTDTMANAVKQKLTAELDIDDDTYNELMKKWQDEKREIGNKITNLKNNSRFEKNEHRK